MKRWKLVTIGVLAAVGVFGFTKWKDASNHGGQKPAEPFRIAGNLYYVGANDVTSFLITGPEGHVLIDGGYPGTAPMIMESIAKLGFNIRDVKVLLNSHGHFDHAGGLAELQRASGAQFWVSEGDAHMLETGGDDPSLGPMRLLMWLHLAKYPSPRIDHRFKDGDTVRVGPVALTAHVTAGHTPGCTSWSFPVQDGDRQLNVVHVCGLKGPVSLSREISPEVRAQMEGSIRTLRGLPADIWLTAHAAEFGRYRKFVEQSKAKNPADPFIDPAGYRAYIDSAEARLNRAR